MQMCHRSSSKSSFEENPYEDITGEHTESEQYLIH